MNTIGSSALTHTVPVPAAPRAIDRKQFLHGVVAGGVLLLLGGCGGGGDDGSAPQSPQACGSSSLEIAANHGHVLSIPLDDLNSTSDRSYGIQGGGLHDHQVTITAAQFAALKAGRPIAVTTSIGGATSHTHDISGPCN